jgi:nickel/cobalt transporter (NicO) family protein
MAVPLGAAPLGAAPRGAAPLGLLAQTDLGWLEAAFVRLFDGGPVGPLAGLGLVLAAMAIGAGHALAPGHGKALLAGYLVGERGRARDAVLFGSLVAALHTISVAVVAVALLVLGRSAACAATCRRRWRWARGSPWPPA